MISTYRCNDTTHELHNEWQNEQLNTEVYHTKKQLRNGIMNADFYRLTDDTDDVDDVSSNDL